MSTPVRSRSSGGTVWLRTGGIGLVCLAKTLDSALTAWLLASQAGVVERNPLARTVFDALGVTEGVVLLTVLALALGIGGVETGALLVRTRSVVTPAVIRLVGYGALTSVWSLAALHNLRLLGRVFLSY